MLTRLELFDTQLLKNEPEHVTSRKISILVSDKTETFKQKSEFWKICINPWGLEGFHILKYFTDEIGCNNKNMAFCCIMKCVKTYITQ